MKNEYMTAQQAAEKWNISDRRVRVLCREGKISGAVKDGKSYKIPANAEKPADGREKKATASAVRFLKWENDVIGTIDSMNTVTFTKPEFNKVVSLYIGGAKKWTPVSNQRLLCICLRKN